MWAEWMVGCRRTKAWGVGLEEETWSHSGGGTGVAVPAWGFSLPYHSQGHQGQQYSPWSEVGPKNRWLWDGQALPWRPATSQHTCSRHQVCSALCSHLLLLIDWQWPTYLLSMKCQTKSNSTIRRSNQPTQIWPTDLGLCLFLGWVWDDSLTWFINKLDSAWLHSCCWELPTQLVLYKPPIQPVPNLTDCLDLPFKF